MKPFFRIFLIAFYVYLFYQYLTKPYYWWFLDNVNLLVHEAGHFIVGIFGNETLGVLGGSLLQWLLPILFGVYFVRQKDYFASTFAGMWLATALYSSYVYIGDSVVMGLDMLIPGSTHDWNYLLTVWGMLDHTTQIANAFRLASLVVLGVSIVGGVTIVVRGIRSRIKIC